jgi:GNAT superfamily N-acetyltransferase
MMKKSVRLPLFELVAQDIADVDVKRLHALSLAVGWSYRAQDWDLMRRIGRGIVAVDGIGRVFGSAMWFPQGEDFATIGLVITTPRIQTQGGGRWLMEQVFEQCGDRNLALNATRAADHLYASLGFTKEASVYMRQGTVPPTLPAVPPVDGELGVLSGGDVGQIADLDRRAFGSDRGKVLAVLAENASICTLRRGGEIVGYSMRREFGRGQDAIHLTAVHLKNLTGQFARVDTREKDGLFAEYLQHSGLDVAEIVTTMSKGRRFLDPKEDEPRVYGLAGHALS